MPPITTIMVLTNVGLQLFNSLRSANTSEEMRKKQQEFQAAAQKKNHERMMQLLREGQALQEEMETQMHKDRIKNINEDFDNLIKRVFHSAALGEWPLRVLPMVMKNQSLGSYRANGNENIALHVIFTPSNCSNFNTAVFPQIEQGLEVFMNRHWTALSSHPILFYGGAWKSGVAPTHNEIAQLKADLPHLPVLMITPYFQPNNGKLVFNIHMWGMGGAQDLVIQPTEKEFSYYNVYGPDLNYGEDLASTTIEEFVPYLQCLIGYLADVYFWSAHSVAPILPSLLTMGAVNTDGMKYLLSSNQERYDELLTRVLNTIKQYPLSCEKLLALYEGDIAFGNKETQKRKLNDIVLDYFNAKTGSAVSDIQSIEFDAINKTKYDISFLQAIASIYESYFDEEKELLKKIKICLESTKKKEIKTLLFFVADEKEFCALLKGYQERNQNQYFIAKVISKEVVIGFYNYSKVSIEYDYKTSLYVIVCPKLLHFHTNENYIIEVKSLVFNKLKKTILSDIKVDRVKLSNYLKQKENDLEKCCEIEEMLQGRTSLKEIIVDQQFDLLTYLQKSLEFAKKGYNEVSLYRAYSRELQVYHIYILGKKDNVEDWQNLKHLEFNILPLSVQKIFNNKHKLTIKIK